ncbi:MAG TPA: hypothetical protein VES00_09455, partial [Burkholderiaceae bacterium]|nr:hypothetical protein [Burkholderiaceae bacterium]
MTTPRVALIAVHGVADQQPGETARAVVDLLVSSAPDGTCYTSASTEALSLRVPPLLPQQDAQPPGAHAAPATPKGEDRPLMKSLAQSARSDFQSQGWGAPPPPSPRAHAAAKSADTTAPPAQQDRGIALTNYLLAKHVRNGAATEDYDTRRITLQRHGVGPDDLDGTDDDTATRVDVYEMYWADLSRLSGSMPRIVSELFTLVFRLSKLGRETVDEMSGQLARARAPGARWGRLHARAWGVVTWLQIGLDWLFVNGLALLFTQLALLGTLLVCLGFTSGLSPATAADAQAAATAALHESWLHHGVAIALGVLAVLRLVYRRGDGRWLQFALPTAVLAVAGWALAFEPALLQWITALTFLAALTIVNEIALRIADDRFPLVHVVGRWLWAASALLMLGSAVHETQAVPASSWREIWVHAALFTTETVLLMIKWWWIVVGPLLLVWFVAGQLARGESGYASRASIATGRLGLTVSFGMFLAVTMTTWALLEPVLDDAVEGTGYRPCIFAFEPAAGAPQPAASAGANACMWTSRNAKEAAAHERLPGAHAVLDDRYAKSTSAFSLLATLLLALVAYALTMFTPSVLAELKLIADARRDAHQQQLDKRHPKHARATLHQRTQRARALGRWLTAGYRRLDAVVACVSALGVALSAGIALLFLSTVFEQKMVAAWIAGAHLDGLVGWLAAREDDVSSLSRGLTDPLQAAVFSAAGIGAALSLLGGTLSRRLPSLRGPLDVAMDVDNHFREFPRTDIPRAHIFSRYAALLKHLQSQGYERIVIVSHSQGTVISSELLRFLSSRDQRAPAAGATPLVAGRPLPPISLLTLGCPLRQLYGARFPGLYAWVLARNGAAFGPRADDIGVQRWMNAFCSGDYVGRWLWSSADKSAALAHPTISAVGHDPFGRVDAYTGFNPMPPAEAHLHEAREAEVCLGLGAHTHYFDRDQSTVAWMIDWLVRARPLGEDEGPSDLERPVPTIDATDGPQAQVVPADASVVSDGVAAPAAAPDAPAPAPSAS